LLFERATKTVEARFPQAQDSREPGVEFVETLRSERVEAPLSIGPPRDKACFVQDAQMPGNTGLMDSHLLDNVTDLHLAVPQDFDNEAAGGVG